MTSGLIQLVFVMGFLSSRAPTPPTPRRDWHQVEAGSIHEGRYRNALLQFELMVDRSWTVADHHLQERLTDDASKIDRSGKPPRVSFSLQNEKGTVGCNAFVKEAGESVREDAELALTGGTRWVWLRREGAGQGEKLHDREVFTQELKHGNEVAFILAFESGGYIVTLRFFSQLGNEAMFRNIQSSIAFADALSGTERRQ